MHIVDKKYLKAYKTKGRSYWWLVETHYESGKVHWKKLRYWGVNKPSLEYTLVIMPSDDGGPLDNLVIVWQTEDGKWHCRKAPRDYLFWQKRGQEKWFWESFSKDIKKLFNPEKEEMWITKASKQSEAIKSVKNGKATNMISWLVLQRIEGETFGGIL